MYTTPTDLKALQMLSGICFIFLILKIIGKKTSLEDYLIYLSNPVITEYLNMRKHMK